MTKAAIGSWVYVMVFFTLVSIVLYALAAYFDSTNKVRESATVGAIASGLQLLGLLVIAFDAIGESSIRLGSGWFLWLIIAAVGLTVSIELLTKGRERVTARLKTTKASIDARGQASAAAPHQQPQAPAPGQWAPQQGQWAPQQPQQAPQQQGWDPQPQEPGQQAQQ